jgi:hypothetical protein
MRIPLDGRIGTIFVVLGLCPFVGEQGLVPLVATVVSGGICC